MSDYPALHFVCLPCRVYQRTDNICADCDRIMQHGTLCRCGEAKAASGADVCLECLADEVRADSSTLDTLDETLRAEVLASMRASAEPTYSAGFITRRQAS